MAKQDSTNTNRTRGRNGAEVVKFLARRGVTAQLALHALNGVVLSQQQKALAMDGATEEVEQIQNLALAASMMTEDLVDRMAKAV